MSSKERTVFEGVGDTLEQAMQNAHQLIPLRPHRDFAVSRTLEWGMQRGGFTDQTVFWVTVIEEPDVPFRT